MTAKFRGILVDQQNVNPLLKPLANNGGFTQTHALEDKPPSPAINAAPVYSAPAVDQRGVKRPKFACSPPCHYMWRSLLADIGAYEYDFDPGQTLAIETVRPRSINISTEKLVLLVEGEKLLPGATVYWNGTPLATEVRDSSHVEAYVQPELFSRCGEYLITVGNPGTEPSSPLTFYVDGCDDIRMDETKR